MPKSLDQLSEEYLDAKRNAAAWTQSANDVAAQIIALVGLKDEGTTSTETDRHKVKTTSKINRSITVKEAAELRKDILESTYERLLTWKPSLVVKELRFLEENHPDQHAAVVKRITSKPAKPTVTVEAVES